MVSILSDTARGTLRRLPESPAAYRPCCPRQPCCFVRQASGRGYVTTVRLKKRVGSAQMEPTLFKSCGDRIRTCDLEVMSLASYRTAPPRDMYARTPCGDSGKPCILDDRVPSSNPAARQSTLFSSADQQSFWWPEGLNLGGGQRPLLWNIANGRLMMSRGGENRFFLDVDLDVDLVFIWPPLRSPLK